MGHTKDEFVRIRDQEIAHDAHIDEVNERLEYEESQKYEQDQIDRDLDSQRQENINQKDYLRPLFEGVKPGL